MRQATQPEILAAGAIAAFTVDVLIYPLDTIKTRYQSRGFLKLKDHASSGTRAPYTVVRGLYQGIGSVVLATLPAAAIFFASYESTKSFLKHAMPASTPCAAIHAFASAGAEMASCFVLTPAEVVKQNAQVLQRRGSSILGRSSSAQAFQMLRRSEGGITRTLRRGYAALVARNLPFTAIQFPMFEYFRSHIWEWCRHRSYDFSASATARPTMHNATGAVVHDNLRPLLVETGLVTGSAAAVSGSIAATITTPADVVKTRVMLGAKDILKNTEAQRSRHTRLPHSSGIDVVRDVLRESGIRGLFRGAMLRATWAALGSGLYLGSYEVAKIWLKQPLL